jgi:glycosyltransferase involved in cell wall biosynthesis
VEISQQENTGNVGDNNYPLISIVVAVYNGSAYLLQQLQSIAKQTYPNIEIIIVDDCSTDNTSVIINDFVQLNANARVFYNSENLGYIKNFSRGCLLAKGALVALSDQDDYWLPQKLLKLFAAMGNSSLVYCDSALCDENLQLKGINLSERINFKNFDNCLQQAIFGRIPGHAMLVTKKLLDKCLPFSGDVNHDWWLGFAATIYGGAKFFPEPLVFYRQHSNNLFGAVGNKNKKNKQEQKKEKKQKEFIKARQRMKAFYEFCPGEKLYEKKILKVLAKSYESFSLINNLQRMICFFANYQLLLASKKRNKIRKRLFCFKMFFTIT